MLKEGSKYAFLFMMTKLDSESERKDTLNIPIYVMMGISTSFTYYLYFGLVCRKTGMVDVMSLDIIVYSIHKLIFIHERASDVEEQ